MLCSSWGTERRDAQISWTQDTHFPCPSRALLPRLLLEQRGQSKQISVGVFLLSKQTASSHHSYSWAVLKGCPHCCSNLDMAGNSVFAHTAGRTTTFYPQGWGPSGPHSARWHYWSAHLSAGCPKEMLPWGFPHHPHSIQRQLCCERLSFEQT